MNGCMVNKRIFAVVVFILLLCSAGFCADGNGGEAISLWSTIKAGGVIGFIIIFMSVAAVSLVVLNFISIRRSRFVPEVLCDELANTVRAGDYKRAGKICEEDDSFLSEVVSAGLEHVEAMFGFFEMQNAMQEAAERKVSQIGRKLDYLRFIGATAPMMGLLGTVTGMIRSFNEIAVTGGAARAPELAAGISEALITTCLGLIVAIPTMFFVTFFRNRVDSCVAETELAIEKIMHPLRKREVISE